MEKRVSLKDIAGKLGVSIAVVSYVLNGQEKEKRVGADLAVKIRQTAEELNYQPNQIARSLRMKSTNTIGLIVADIANPFFGQLARYVENEAGKFGYTVIFGSSDENAIKSENLINTLLNRQVDGFIIVPAEGTVGQIQNLIKKNVPHVLVDRFFPELNSSYVILDNYAASFHATNHLINKGFINISMIAYNTSLIHMKERIRGYMEAMKNNNLTQYINCSEVSFEESYDDICLALDSLKIDSMPHAAVVFATSALSVSGLYWIQKNNIKVPLELGFVGFDGGESFDLYNPPLSFVQQPLEEISREAFRILLNHIKGDENCTQIQLKPELIVRSS